MEKEGTFSLRSSLSSRNLSAGSRKVEIEKARAPAKSFVARALFFREREAKRGRGKKRQTKTREKDREKKKKKRKRRFFTAQRALPLIFFAQRRKKSKRKNKKRERT